LHVFAAYKLEGGIPVLGQALIQQNKVVWIILNDQYFEPIIRRHLFTLTELSSYSNKSIFYIFPPSMIA
jgi:hypothetical protein